MRPPFLKSGDTVGLIAPARKISEDVVQRAEEIFHDWGLKTQRAEMLLSTSHSYHGATVAERTTDFQRLLDDPAVKAIVCVRGGYGSTQFVDQIRWEKFKESPKWIVGFSDVTALHLQIHRLGIESVHSLMALQFKDEKQQPARERLKQILFGATQALQWKTVPGSKVGECAGQLVGGNLSLITDSLATANELHTFGQILFLEEVDEPFYKVDKMLTHLKRAKKLDKIRGLVVGYFTDIKDTDIPYGETFERIILNHVPASIPIAFGCPSGHEAPNMPWIHGANVKLIVAEENSTLEFVSESNPKPGA